MKHLIVLVSVLLSACDVSAVLDTEPTADQGACNFVQDNVGRDGQCIPASNQQLQEALKNPQFKPILDANKAQCSQTAEETYCVPCKYKSGDDTGAC